MQLSKQQTASLSDQFEFVSREIQRNYEDEYRSDGIRKQIVQIKTQFANFNEINEVNARH